MKKELAVAALRNGTVIDHIPPRAVFRIVEMLGLSSELGAITIGNNLPSENLGLKGIIKVSDREFAREDINRIALVAPSAVINTIRDYTVVSKTRVELPDELTGLCTCPNPKCITRNEPMPSRFHKVLENGQVRLRCHYCEHELDPQTLL